MIRVYFLRGIVDSQTNTEVIQGSEYIHGAILECTDELQVWKLIQDTTGQENAGLLAVAESWRKATPEEIAKYKADVVIIPPDPDAIRAREIIGSNPNSIPMPIIRELLAIIVRKLYP